jgi:hypothetical protein
MQSTTPAPSPIPYRRSAFQVALLLFATGGVYTFFWSFYVRRWCSATLQKREQSLWKSIALIVPIFNLALIFEVGELVKIAAARSALARSTLPLPWLALSALPDPYWYACVLSFVPIAVVQLVLVRAELALDGWDATPTRFHWIEWLVVVVGSLMWVTVALSAWLPDDAGHIWPAPWVPLVVLALAFAALVALARAGRRDLARLESFVLERSGG